MRITICAVGRLKPGPESALVEDYLARFDRAGRALGLGPAAVTEIDDRRTRGPDDEETLLDRAVPAQALRLALDERGRALSSTDFAARLAGWRDAGQRHLAVLIGGADGLGRGLRDSAGFTLALGPMVWPHKLARVMFAEQLYRAATILAGSPYHRD